MNVNKIILRIKLSLIIIFLITVIIFSVLGRQKRLGYISEIKPYDVEKISETYTYRARIRHYDKIFRPSDIFNVYPSKENQPNPITKIELQEYGKPFVYVTVDKELDTSKNIDIYYTLKIKPNIICISILLLFICLALLFRKTITNYINDNSLYRITMCFLGFSLTAIIIIFVYYNLKNSGWLFGDDHAFLTSTTQGIMQVLPIWGDRFFPLGHLHINMLIPFGNNPFVYLLQNNSFLIITLILLYFTLQKYADKKISISLLLILLVLPDITKIYTMFIFSESFILPILTLFILMYKKGIDTNKNIYFITALLASVYATYCKEPVFGLFAVFSLTQLLFTYKNLTKKQKYFLYSLLINALIFVCLYIYATRGFTGLGYAKERTTNISTIDILILYFKHHNIFTIFLIIAFIRAFYILIKKDKRFIIFDAYLYSGIAYTCAYIALKFTGAYYTTPSYICYITASAGYLKYIYDNIKIKNKEYVFNAALIFTLLLIFAIQTPRRIEQINGAVEGRRRTSTETQLLVDIDNAKYKIYVYYPSEIPEYLQHTHYVLNVFASVWKNNGKYIKEYKPLTPLYHTNSVNPNEKTVILYNTQYDPPNKNIGSLNQTNFRLYNYFHIFGMEMFVQNEKDNEIASLIEKANKKYIK